ncbi:MAG: hypothetical protein CL832_06920 [Crocinitomicaceae bacterium]|nr:hypothetical protein [Crocinitomicaceae bacterium]|tara:strand:+ start:1325 stop:2299 length:975 start_codon:yes stop_codon:yes gene_type:complete
MKKINYLLTILSISVGSLFAQQNVGDFENLTLSSESYWDGSDMSGLHNNSVFATNFSSGGYNFNNTYDTTWGAASGYWSSGWAYSNMTDSTTSGFTNQYSAKPGGGHPIGGANYAIGKPNSTIVFNNPDGLSINITNSTYAANSMRDGDAFAKKFTNADQDYFKLHIYGYSNGSILDSTEFYLADFTHADSTLDYIVTDWQYVELLPGPYDSVSFDLSSSDVGAFGMNTPAYFCIDNVGNFPLLSNTINQEIISIYPNPSSDFIYINRKDSDNYTISLFNILGELIIDKKINLQQLNLSNLPNGQYFLKIESESGIINERILKI